MPTIQPAPIPGADFDAAAAVLRQLLVEKVPARALAARLGVTEARLSAQTIQNLEGWIGQATVALNAWADLLASIDGLTEVLESEEA